MPRNRRERRPRGRRRPRREEIVHPSARELLRTHQVLAKEELDALVDDDGADAGWHSQASWLVVDRELVLLLVHATDYHPPAVPMRVAFRLVLWRFLRQFVPPPLLWRRIQKIVLVDGATWPRPGGIACYAWHVAQVAVEADAVLDVLAALIHRPTVRDEWGGETEEYAFHLFEVAFWCGIEITTHRRPDGYRYVLNGRELPANAGLGLIADFPLLLVEQRDGSMDYIRTGKYVSLLELENERKRLM
jgi:hypothetical protein